MSLKSILRYEHLMELYEEGVGSVETPLTDRFFVNPETVYGDEAKLFVDPIENRPGKLNRRSSPARMMDLVGAQEQRGAMFYAFNQKRLDSDLLHGLQQPDNQMVDRLGAREVRRQIMHFGKQHAIMKELVLAKFLTGGQVLCDVDGNIVESNGDETYTFGIAAGHQDQLDWDGGGDIIGTAWDDAGADIEKDLEEIDDASRKINATPPSFMLTNSTTKQWLRNNTTIREMALASFIEPDKMLKGQFVENLFGREWMFYDAVYEDSSGTVRKMIPDGIVAMVPADISRWLRPVQGVSFVPTSLEIAASLEAALNNWTEVEGRFAYAAVEHNPPALDLFIGDSFGMIVANPSAVWQATVDF